MRWSIMTVMNREGTMKIKSFTIIAVLGLLSAIFPLGVVAHASTWSGSGPGNVTVFDGTTSNPQLQYLLQGPDVWFTEMWDFHTIADADGEIELPYLYEGFHAWFQVRVFLRAYVTHNSVTTFFPLVDLGPVDCCDSPSGGFSIPGTATLNVQAGDTYGFQFGGSNFDEDMTLLGTFTIMLPAEVSINVIPKKLNVKKMGVLPVVVFGSADLDVATIDLTSIRLEGVAPIRSNVGARNLRLKFRAQEIVSVLGEVDDGDEVVLHLTGNLKEESGGGAIMAEDTVLILKKGKK